VRKKSTGNKVNESVFNMCCFEIFKEKMSAMILGYDFQFLGENKGRSEMKRQIHKEHQCK
jgi:hypothetical protein